MYFGCHKIVITMLTCFHCGLRGEIVRMFLSFIVLAILLVLLYCARVVVHDKQNFKIPIKRKS